LSLLELPQSGASSIANHRVAPAEAMASPPPLAFRQRARVTAEVLATVLATADFILIIAAASGACWTYFNLSGMTAPPRAHFFFSSLLAAVLFVAGFERIGGYQPKRLRLLRWQLIHTLIIWCVTIAILLGAAYTAKTSDAYSRGWAATWMVIGCPLLLAARGALHLVITHSALAKGLARNIAIVGAGKEAQWLIHKLHHACDPRFSICGLFDDRFSRGPAVVAGVNVLGTSADLIELARSDQLDEIIFALPLDDEATLPQLLGRLKEYAVDLRLSVGPLVQRFGVSGVSLAGDAPVLEIANRPFKHWRAVFKWTEDKLLSAVLLFWLAPLLALISTLIKLETRGPVFFVQERFGFNNNVIQVLKFRTMHIDSGDPTGAARTVRNDPRVTRLGGWLRRLSLDELPQLINVLRGDMSMIGPRPHAVAMRAGDRLYGEAVEEYCRRHRVKPGITGWAQVNGLRGEVDTVAKGQARLNHDLYYIDHWTPWLDIKILLMTVGILVAADNAY
jgi:Undecaprenyl-phosphate glucose phosphotransferase